MNFLLVGINAKYIHSNLAIRSLRAYAEDNKDLSINYAEYTINMQSREIVRDIYEQKPDFIGISTYIWNVETVFQVVRDIKLILPKVIIYLGGPEVSYETEKILEALPEITGIMIGEGEETFKELVEFYTGVSPYDELSQIRGLAVRGISEIVHTAPRPVLDLSTVPFPYGDMEELKNRIIYYETSRGCPFGCAYCLSSVDKAIRFRAMHLIKDELRFFLDAQVPQVKFVDRTFNIDHERSLEILNFLKENDNGITNFHFEIAGDILTIAEIDMINSLRPGLIQLEIGVQSTNNQTLAAINRHTNMEKLSNNVARLLKGGKVHIHLDLIAGLPYEDLNSFKKSFNDVFAMKGHELQLGFLKVLKGAPIRDRCKEQQIKHSPYAPYEVLSTGYLTYSEICELKSVEEMLEIYHNSCQFIYAEEYLLPRHTSPYEYFLRLASFYEESGQPLLQYKRVVRYEILISYAEKKLNFSQSELLKLRMLLTLDYYSREKAKARPDFAPQITGANIKAIKKQIHEMESRGNYHIEPVLNNLFSENNEAEGLCFVTFDYDKRSPITGNCEVSSFESLPVSLQ